VISCLRFIVGGYFADTPTRQKKLRLNAEAQKASKIRYPPADFNQFTKKIDTVSPVCLFFCL
jgi:hypothetical protein